MTESNKCPVCGEVTFWDCDGKPRCPVCDPPCPKCDDGSDR